MIKLISYLILLTLLQPVHAFTVSFSEITQLKDIDFEDVNDQLLQEITGRGMVISYTSHADVMLQRTSKQIDPQYQTYNNALIHLFCSAKLSHPMTKETPHMLAGCPFAIAIYQTTDQPNSVFISYRRTQLKEYQPIIKLMSDIIKETKSALD
ncbi:MAG: hypothetical protein DSZ16_03240 [Candidatus Thioglobus sp.]|nr:MAG: hypothetical protein DSY29_00860 [Alphaproteobacteria bacterium]RUM81968.1 MAG: hypothetical protein DSZ16_03240 [Candidatus Thioglobus sp.]